MKGKSEPDKSVLRTEIILNFDGDNKRKNEREKQKSKYFYSLSIVT